MRLRHWLEARAIDAVDEIFRVLSWESAQAFGAALGGAARFLGRKRWHMTLGNVAAAFPEMSPEAHERIAREAWQNAGKIAAEFAKSRHMTQEEIERRVVFENFPLVDQLMAEGKGIIFNIGHLGNWEVGGIGFTAHGYPLGVVGRAMPNPYLDAWIIATRSRFGEAVFPHRSPFFPAVRWIKKGGVIAVLIDHNIPEGGIFVPFFGRPAATSTLSALLAVKLGCPILSTRVWREGAGLRVRFDGPLRPDPAAGGSEAEVERLTIAMVRDLEAYVRERPGEWLWGHNRWKRRPEASARDSVAREFVS